MYRYGRIILFESTFLCKIYLVWAIVLYTNADFLFFLPTYLKTRQHFSSYKINKQKDVNHRYIHCVKKPILN